MLRESTVCKGGHLRYPRDVIQPCAHAAKLHLRAAANGRLFSHFLEFVRESQ
jgi:hypothetical protein